MFFLNLFDIHSESMKSSGLASDFNLSFIKVYFLDFSRGVDIVGLAPRFLENLYQGNQFFTGGAAIKNSLIRLSATFSPLSVGRRTNSPSPSRRGLG
jgi:hypothetical protein